MLRFCEVYGWLRYSLSRDPLCTVNKLVCEEIPSTLIPYNDVTDGCRTLAIYRAADGMSPRVELRMTGLHPQIRWLTSENEPDGEYIQITNPMGFPGDGASWDVSDTVEALISIAKEKFCPTLKVVMAAEDLKDSKKIIDLPTVERIVDAVQRASKNGKRLTDKTVTEFLKKNNKGDLADFANSVMEYFEKGKLKWEEIKYLEKDMAPGGKDIIPWSWMKRKFETNDALMDRLPTPIADEVVGKAEDVKQLVEDLIEACAAGETLQLNELRSHVRFGQSVMAAIANRTLSGNHLQAIARCDVSETIAPWSWLSRRFISNEIKACSESLPDAVMAWLEHSNLLMPLYRAKEDEREALKIAVSANVEQHIKNTLQSAPWMKYVLASLAGSKDDMERRCAVQSEFDMWLLNALSPSVDATKIPLSTYAFSTDRKDQKQYANMVSAFVNILRDWAKTNNQESLACLTNSLKNVYAELQGAWDRPALRGYKPKVPSVAKIIEAVQGGDRGQLFKVLVADIESEVGSEVPADVRAKIEASPYFNSVFTEVRVQSVKL